MNDQIQWTLESDALPAPSLSSAGRAKLRRLSRLSSLHPCVPALSSSSSIQRPTLSRLLQVAADEAAMEDGEQIAFKQAPKRQKLDTSGVGRVRHLENVPKPNDLNLKP